MQRRTQRQRPIGQVLQQILAMPGRLPAPPALSRHVGLRQTFPEMRGAPHRGLRRAQHPTPTPTAGRGQRRERALQESQEQQGRR